MTDLLEHAIERVRALPPETHDDVARFLLQLTGEAQSLIPLTPEEDAAVAESEAAAARGDFASDDEIRAIWATHGL